MQGRPSAQQGSHVLDPAAVRGSLARSAVPREVRVVDVLLRGAPGKVHRSELGRQEQR